MAYMREAIPLLEQDESIEMYAWFLGAFSEHLLPKKVPASESSQVATWNIYDWHTHEPSVANLFLCLCIWLQFKNIEDMLHAKKTQ